MKIAFNFPGGQIDPVAGMPSGGVNTLGKILQVGITLLFITVFVTALIFLILGGIQWIISQGDKTKVEAARKKITYAIIGLIVAFSSYLIISLVGDFFNEKLLSIPAPRCGGETFGTCPNPDRPVCRRDDDTGRYRRQCRRSDPGCAF